MVPNGIAELEPCQASCRERQPTAQALKPRRCSNTYRVPHEQVHREGDDEYNGREGDRCEDRGARRVLSVEHFVQARRAVATKGAVEHVEEQQRRHEATTVGGRQEPEDGKHLHTHTRA